MNWKIWNYFLINWDWNSLYSKNFWIQGKLQSTYQPNLRAGYCVGCRLRREIDKIWIIWVEIGSSAHRSIRLASTVPPPSLVDAGAVRWRILIVIPVVSGKHLLVVVAHSIGSDVPGNEVDIGDGVSIGFGIQLEVVVKSGLYPARGEHEEVQVARFHACELVDLFVPDPEVSWGIRESKFEIRPRSVEWGRVVDLHLHQDCVCTCDVYQNRLLSARGIFIYLFV